MKTKKTLNILSEMFRRFRGAALLVLAFFLVTLTSCDPMEKDVVGKWKVYNAEVVEGSFSDEEKEEIVKFIQGTKYDFREDGTIVFVDDYLNEKKGVWSLDRDVISVEYEISEDYYGRRYGSYKQKAHLKIMSNSFGKMSLKETYQTGESAIYYLERID